MEHYFHAPYTPAFICDGVYGLFNDVASSFNRSGMMAERPTKRGVKQTGRGLTLLCRHLPRGTEVNREKYQDIRSPGRDLNPGRPAREGVMIGHWIEVLHTPARPQA